MGWSPGLTPEIEMRNALFLPSEGFPCLSAPTAFVPRSSAAETLYLIYSEVSGAAEV